MERGAKCGCDASRHSRTASRPPAPTPRPPEGQDVGFSLSYALQLLSPQLVSPANSRQGHARFHCGALDLSIISLAGFTFGGKRCPQRK